MTADALRLRAAPTTAAAILTRLAAGTRVDLWAEVGDWRLVQLPDGMTGWAHADYLETV